jgi:hypothetical protein
MPQPVTRSRPSPPSATCLLPPSLIRSRHPPAPPATHRPSMVEVVVPHCQPSVGSPTTPPQGFYRWSSSPSPPENQHPNLDRAAAATGRTKPPPGKTAVPLPPPRATRTDTVLYHHTSTTTAAVSVCRDRAILGRPSDLADKAVQ